MKKSYYLTKEEAKELYDNDLMPFIKSAVKHALNPIDFCINFNLLIKMAERLQISESTISRNLSKLKEIGAIAVNQQGKTKYISVTTIGKIFLKIRKKLVHKES